MKVYTKTIASFLLAFLCVSTANAEYTVPNDPAFVFALTGSKDHSVQPLWAGFQFTFKQLQNESGDVVGTRLTFDLTDYGYEQGWDGGKNTVKIKPGSFDFDPNDNGWISGLFDPDPPVLNWNNDGWTPTYTDLLFAENKGWDDLASAVLDGAIQIHVQSINVGGKNSIYQAVFTLKPDGIDPPSATPEPATLLIFGLGVAGAGIAARRRKR